METLPNEYTETRTPIILHDLREALDKRKLQSTPDKRTVSVIELILREPFKDGDPLCILRPFFPPFDSLTEWYQEHKVVIDELRKEDRHKAYTDRHMLETDIEVYETSAWLALSKKITAHLSMGVETANADIAIKLMYQQAQNAYNDTLHELARLSIDVNQEESLPTAS